eukprot:6207768-Pleurochrysis_carterae.AAC.3
MVVFPLLLALAHAAALSLAPRLHAPAVTNPASRGAISPSSLESLRLDSHEVSAAAGTKQAFGKLHRPSGSLSAIAPQRRVRETTMIEKPIKVGVVGVTGAVGKEIVQV